MNPTEPSEELFVLTLDVIEDDEQLEAWADDFIRRDALAQRRASEIALWMSWLGTPWMRTPGGSRWRSTPGSRSAGAIWLPCWSGTDSKRAAGIPCFQGT